MSNDIGNEVLPEETPLDEGQLAEAQDVIESLTEEQIDLLPVDEFGDKYVSVTIDGEELRVPLKEALSGYQRQADYTRKTQELSEQRRNVQFGAALQEALQNDPQGTLALLSQHYGVEQTPSEEEDLYQDPMEKQYKSLEKRIQAFEQQKAMDELERTVQKLQNRYGEDFDANEVVSKALAIGSTDLESVYKQIAFDRVWSESASARKEKSARAEQEQKVIQAKRQAGVVSSGSTAKSADVSAKPITSLRDAFEAAKRQHSV